MVMGPVDYVKTYFIHPTLTKVHGEPIYSSLRILKQELKANASRVTSDLGGGAHGHLGLVLDPTEYANISGTPYVHTAHPGTLTILAGTTHHEATRLTVEHAERVRVFRESVELEKVLVNQTCNALDETFYKERVNPATNTVTEKLSDFLSWLFTTYGDIDSDTIAHEAQKILEFSYDLQNPITDIFEPIQELEQLAIAGNRPYTQA